YVVRGRGGLGCCGVGGEWPTDGAVEIGAVGADGESAVGAAKGGVGDHQFAGLGDDGVVEDGAVAQEGGEPVGGELEFAGFWGGRGLVVAGGGGRGGRGGRARVACGGRV